MHKQEVINVRPSLVLLSGGADFQLKIWSLIDGSNPVTLKGHTSASSRDGTIRLWNCGTADTIAVVGSYNCSVSKILLAKLPKHIEPADPKALDEREVDTADCMVIAALADGSARFIHLGTKQELFSATGDDVPLTCIAYDAETEVLVTGDRQGVVRVFCLSELNAPVVAWQRNEHAVTDIQLKPDEEGSSTLCVANADGSIYQTGSLDAILEKKKVQVLAEYSGNELENVRGLRVMASPAGQSRLVSTIETGQICLY
ncbi:WD40-repeat-containing domain protein [Radiomyces spectabilis]|uniref:WD40-repeat-containing domain protein n=1 Tax=Radiomyces spectabilis TaxID=64574 RepID=UPI0022204654|nr:WD40-repeat-containing domain protein [Radiomyces spectabilis]KAI8394131.1 WD40-repeat-containing domain protein [Radiomyces spectabilis]